ncbi:MAG: PD-(D/E)XK nuclease family transposase [Abditibacteriota bacterium]|nr:PD-(D/E)XK nuclease family transposase [Abditibacteriota bacterium]
MDGGKPQEETSASERFQHPKPFGVNQVYYERIQNMRLMDDTLMTAALDGNIEATQFLLRTILKMPNLIVTRSKSQVEFKNLFGHSLRMDVDARTEEDERIDIEVERDKYRASPERSRYQLAIRDASFLPQGENFKKLPTTYLVFITETDYWGDGLAVYHVDRKVRENDKYFNDRAHIVYVNGSYVGDDEIGRLIADLRESNPDKMRNPELANRVRALKNSETEVRKMCKAMEITFEEGRKDGHAEGRKEGRIEALVQSIRNLMNRHGQTADESMDDLAIIGDERDACIAYMVAHQAG